MKQPQSIAVLGAGVMGLMAAYTLRTYLPATEITIFDRDATPQNNASNKAGGMLAPYAELDHMPQDYLGAASDSLKLWGDIQKALKTDFELRENGSLIIAHAEDKHLLSRFSGILPKNDQWSAIQGEAIRTLEPSLDADIFSNGLHLKAEGHLHPRKAMEALRNFLPPIIQKHIAPEDIVQDFNLVIDCRGMGACDYIDDLRGVKGEILIVHNPEFHLNRPLRLMHPRYPLYIVPREGNIFMIGATIIESAESESISIRSAMELQSALYSIHRSFGDSKILEMTAGIRPALPKNMPIISMEGQVIRCNGLFRHGFLLAPVMAESLACYIQGTHTPHFDLFAKEGRDEHISQRTAFGT